MQKRLYVGAFAVALTALVSPLALDRAAPAAPADAAIESQGRLKKLPVGLARKFAAMATFSPGAASLYQERAGGPGVQDWIEHSTPGLDIPFAAFAGARNDWRGLKARPAVGGGAWTAQGPVNGLSAENPYRDRSVYNAGTENFSGRTIAAAIDPACVSGDCRLWLANANGGVWMTGDALAPEPAWEFQSHTFEHNNVAELTLDPNDPASNTLWAGTGEPNACGSGCTAGVGLYKSTNGGKSWQGPHGTAQFAGRAVGSIAVQPGNSQVVFAASGRGVLGVSNTCCGGADALIPGAPHFGLYRSLNGGSSWELVNQGAPALCTASTPDQVALNQTPCGPRGARRVMFDPVDANTVYVSFFARGIWRSRDLGDNWEQIMAPVGPVGTTERAEFDVVQLGDETRMYVGVGGGSLGTPAVAQYARFRRSDAVRGPAAAAVAWVDLTSSNVAANPAGYSSFGYCDGQCCVRQLRLRAAGRGRQHRVPGRRLRVQREQLRHGPLEWPRHPALHQRGRALHGHDRGRLGQLLPGAGASGSSRDRHEPRKLAPVLRRGGRRHHPLERRLRGRLGRLRHSQGHHQCRAAGVLPARAGAHPGAPAGHQQRPADTALLPGRIQQGEPRHHHRRHPGQRVLGNRWAGPPG